MPFIHCGGKKAFFALPKATDPTKVTLPKDSEVNLARFIKFALLGFSLFAAPALKLARAQNHRQHQSRTGVGMARSHPRHQIFRLDAAAAKAWRAAAKKTCCRTPIADKEGEGEEEGEEFEA